MKHIVFVLPLTICLTLHTLSHKEASLLASRGISINVPELVHIDPEVTIEAGSTIGMGVHLYGNTHIAADCIVEPFCILRDVELQPHSHIHAHTVLHQSIIGEHAHVGPYANLHDKVVVGARSIIGNYVEIKNSIIGEETKIKHLSYIGDATIGAKTNIGAGTITCNYDGLKKHRTIIGNKVFIGSNNTLIAPITIGDGAFTAAGSTITTTVPPEAFAIARAHQVTKEHYVITMPHMNGSRTAAHQLEFGTDGIRGDSDHFPFVEPYLSRVGEAIGIWAQQKYGTHARILIGHDTRYSCERIKKSLMQSLGHTGHLCVDAHVMPTPALLAIMQANPSKYDFSIMISASHNPAHDNGIKIMDRSSGKIDQSDEQTIIALFNNPSDGISHSLTISDQQESEKTNLATEYCAIITKHFPVNMLKHRTIVLDCANGATSSVAPSIFAALGATVILNYASPNGHNINDHCGATHPAALQKLVMEHNADAGFSFDGDGDRVMMVNTHGTILDGDHLLALLLKSPHYQSTSCIVGTIMSNEGLANYCKQQQVDFIRTPVGDRHISNYLVQHNLLLGSEPSGHIILMDYLPSGDGIFAALRTLETMVSSNNWNGELFAKFPQVNITVPVSIKPDLARSPYAEVIAKYKALIPQGRLVVRYSGTEPILRIMAEDKSYDTAKEIAETLARNLQALLTNTTR